MKHLWNKSPRYRVWVANRDRALERIHTRAQLEAADVLRELFTQVLLLTKANYQGMNAGHRSAIDWYEANLRQAFDKSHAQLIQIIEKTRSRAYCLARASESEIIAQLSPGIKVTASVPKKPMMMMGTAMTISRVHLYLDKLRRKIVSYAQASAMSAKTDLEFAKDVSVAFPRARRVEVPRRTLKPLREADQPIGRKADVAIDNIDEDEWNDMLDSYMNEYVPKSRGPEYVIEEPEVTGAKDWYAWEFERDLTNEFVQSVRDGQIDAANENGITDFVVISIIDDKTCEGCCGDFGCVDFDGMLVSEIEDKTGAEYSAPPYHFNCRCTLAPATDNIPEKPDDGAKDFEEWLNS